VRGLRGNGRSAGGAHIISAKADPHVVGRRSEAFNLAFLLLGGRRAANGYLDSEHPSLGCIPRKRAGGSALGLIEVARVLRRDAMNLLSPTVRA
jgi:hypothetical protein